MDLILAGSNTPLEHGVTPLSTGFDDVTVSKRTHGCIVTEDIGVLELSRVDIDMALLGVVALEKRVINQGIVQSS